MKRLLTTSLILLAIGGFSVAYAQSNRSYQDDIYYNSADQKQDEAKQQAAQEQAKSQVANAKNDDDSNIYSSDESTGNQSNMRQYNDEYSDDYDEDYGYASRINRFYYPFYNRPYYSTFNNPYWYNPYWVDPYWGWSPWVNSGFSVSFGSGPYWTGYSGWSNWYGCSNFGSYYGYGYSPYGGYYSGYWNGYYSGLYNNYGVRNYRTVSYGPRYSLNGRNNEFTHGVGLHGFRRQVPSNERTNLSNLQSNELRSGFRSTNSTQSPRDRANANRNEVDVRTMNHGDNAPRNASENADRSNPRIYESRPQMSNRTGEMNNDNSRNNQQNSQRAPQPQRSRGSWFGRGQSSSPDAGRSFEQPRQERSFSPSVERSTPARTESAPSRSFGGSGSSGGGGGRSFGGGGRHR